MKAIRVHQFGGPEVLALEDIPDLIAGSGEVLVEAKAAGVNPVDTYIRAGLYGERNFPYTPGLDAAGVVHAIGPGVSGIRPGDRVYVYGSLSGTYAQQILCRASQVHPLPPSFTFAQGAAVGVAYLTAYYALVNRAQARPAETALIHGASGGVGIAAVQIARLLELKVFGTAGTEAGLRLVSQEGAHAAFNHTQASYLDDVMKATGGKGVDVIVEMLANQNLGRDLKALARNGRVIVVGSRGQVSIDPRDTMSRNADIRGMAILNVSEQDLGSVHASLQEGLRSGSLRPVVGTELPLAKARQAHEQIMRGGACGKIILVP